MEKELVKIPMTSLDFYRYEENGLVFYEFDATQCQPPEPMVNTMNGLKILENDTDRLIGIFFHEPTPLYEKIGNNYKYVANELENGDFKIVFRKA